MRISCEKPLKKLFFFVSLKSFSCSKSWIKLLFGKEEVLDKAKNTFENLPRSLE